MANSSEIKAFCQAPINATFGLTTDELWKKSIGQTQQRHAFTIGVMIMKAK